MRLAHLHLPGITPFSHAAHLQQTLVSRLLSHKRAQQQSDVSSKAERLETHPPPSPTILTFTPNPVFTTGRRDLPRDYPIAETSPTGLTNPEHLPTPLQPIRHLLTSTKPPLAEFHPTLRGGQTTYHGPGQLVAYTILDLRRLRIGPRAHIRLLENSVLDVLRGYGIERGILTEDPGVWVRRPASTEAARKITAVGVHLRRFVSSYGIGLNVTNEPMWFFQQIVACGLEGRETTSLEREGVRDVSMDDVAEKFVAAFVERINAGEPSNGQGPKIQGVETVSEKYMLGGVV